MTTEPSQARPDAARRERSEPWLSFASGVCLVLAVLLTIPGALAYWGHRTLTDTGRYIATVGPLVESPEVQAAIAAKVTDAITTQVDVEAILDDVFADVITDRPRLAQLTGPVAGAVNSLIDRQVSEFIASDAFADLWVTVNTRAQQRLVRLLEGDESGAVSLQGDQVVLDVSEVIDQVQARLVDRGLTFAANVPIPTVDKQIVLMDAPQLKQARTIYAFANPIATWLILVVLLLYLAAFALARRRPRMAVVIGIGLAANALFLALALSTGRQLFVNSLAGTTFGPASAVFFDTLLLYLQRGLQVLAWLAVILVVAGWFSGQNSTGTALRRAMAHGLERLGSTPSLAGAQGVGRWVGANAGWLRGVAVALGVVVLMWGNAASPTRLLWSVLFVVVLLVVLQVLTGAGRGAERVSAAPAADLEPTAGTTPGP